MEKYNDIIDLPHYDPRNHPRMPIETRAAQFAPFAALNGHSEAIENTIIRQNEELLSAESESID